MTYEPEDEEEPPQVRRLRLLVMTLIVVLIVGFLVIVGTIVIRLGVFGGDSGPVTAERFALPAGEIVATGQGQGTVLFVLRDEGGERLLIYDAGTGALRSATPIERDG